MDKAALVDEDVRRGHDVIALLASAGMPVNDAFWIYQTPIEEWRLVLASPWVDEKGIKTSYLALSNALHKSPMVRQLPIRRISLLSPTDPLVKTARSSVHRPDQTGTLYFRTYNHDVEGLYWYSGALHVVRSEGRGGRPVYHITFAPYRGPGGAVPALEFAGDEALSQFLTDRVHIDADRVRSAIRELQVRGSYSFPEIQLQTKDLRRFGLLSTPTGYAVSR